ncbi:MAG TPA: cob(I)yrinic acid a,c-diamide adenosyltransferase [Actinomycetota bacterium]
MTTQPPTEQPRRATERARSLVLLNTGEGKGKTTAALGTMLRAVGRGWRVCVIQFMKSPEWKTGEEAAAKTLGVDWWTLGDGFTWDSGDMDRTEAIAREAWRTAKDTIASGAYRLVVLDEITYPVSYGWIDVAEVVAAIRGRPEGVSVFITGRDAAPELIELADTATEMRKVKHAFDAGVAAIKGLDH